MIVIDEQLDDPRIEDTIARWYTGTVIHITDMRPSNVIKDDAIASLLHRLNNPTFVTINYKHFWHVIEAHHAYCVVCIKLPAERSLEVPEVLRDILRLDEYRTKRGRMGAVISYRNGIIENYRR